MADLSDTIEILAGEPKSAETDGLKVENQPIPDVIAADNHLKASQGANRNTRGIRFSKIVPPGAD